MRDLGTMTRWVWFGLVALTIGVAFSGCSDADDNEDRSGSDTGGATDGGIIGRCGNGGIEFGEECDDGNTTDDDGCSNSCLFNVGALCTSCAADEDCDFDGLCLDFSNGSFCGLDCTANEVCPTDYECQEILEIDGETETVIGTQCVPENNVCVLSTGTCIRDNGGCDPLTMCFDSGDGTRTCSDCPQGFTGNGADLQGCTDVDECLIDNGGCFPGASCVNQVGTEPICGECPSGFRVGSDGEAVCEDINECIIDGDICGGGTCSNDTGTYICDCDPGYELNDTNTACVNINECIIDSEICGHGTCLDEDPFYTCDCEWPYGLYEGRCVMCPPDTRIIQERPAEDACLPIDSADVVDVLALTAANVRAILTGAAGDLQFLNGSDSLGRFEGGVDATCNDEIEDCTPTEFDTAELIDRANEIADSLRDDILLADRVLRNDGCSIFVGPPADVCDSTIPETCGDGPDDNGCPDGYSCDLRVNTCKAQNCEIDANCGDGFQCSLANECEPRTGCVNDIDCGEDSGYYCDAGTCAEYCAFVDIDFEIELWRVSETDIYAELHLDNGEVRLNPVDMRIFQGQLAATVDVRDTLAAYKMFMEGGRFADPEDEWPFPFPADVGGLVEVNLELTGEDLFEVSVSLRDNDNIDPHTGIYATWMYEALFETFPNEMPLPAIADFSQACPLALVEVDGAEDLISLSTHISPLTITAPFTVLDLFGGKDSDDCFASLDCTACEDDVHDPGCCVWETLDNCNCFDGNTPEQSVIECPCFNEDGMPVTCGSTATPLSCPYDFDGNEIACLPNAGSVQLEFAGQSLRSTLSVNLEADDAIVFTDLAFGLGTTSLRRDGYPTIGTFLDIMTFTFNSGDDADTVGFDLAFPTDREGAVVDLQYPTLVEATFDFNYLGDRMPTAPIWTQSDEWVVNLAGMTPNMQINLVDNSLRPIQLITGALSLYSSFLEASERPPRDPAGTIVLGPGQCLVDSTSLTNGDTHPFEAIEPSQCPTAYSVSRDTTIQNGLTADQAPDVSELLYIEGTGSNPAHILLYFDMSAIPADFAKVELQLHQGDLRTGLPDGTIDILPVALEWMESAVWADGIPLGEAISATVTTADVRDSGDWVSWDVTALVRTWKTNTATNLGLAVVAGYSGFDRIYFDSREADPESRAPRLVVTPAE